MQCVSDNAQTDYLFGAIVYLFGVPYALHLHHGHVALDDLLDGFVFLKFVRSTGKCFYI